MKRGFFTPRCHYTQPNNRRLVVWVAHTGNFVCTPDGYATVYRMERNETDVARKYVIETYAKTIEIECTADTEVLTEHGCKAISELKSGDVVLLKGVFVHCKMSIVKSVKSFKTTNDNLYRATFNKLTRSVFVNDIAIKL